MTFGGHARCNLICHVSILQKEPRVSFTYLPQVGNTTYPGEDDALPDSQKLV